MSDKQSRKDMTEAELKRTTGGAGVHDTPVEVLRPRDDGPKEREDRPLDSAS